MGAEEEEAEMVRLLNSIFLTDAVQRRDEVIENNVRFAHYTSAEVAMSIIQNKAVWMRNAITMNDFSEIHHGKKCVFDAWKAPGGEKLKAVLEGLYPGIITDIETLFTSWQRDLENNTFLTSLSEHWPDEDNLGRLSMWRAYGGRNGVALVLNRTPFETETDNLHAYSAPVFYGDTEMVEQQFDRTADGIIAKRDAFELVPAEAIRDMMFMVLRFTVLCTKHPAFSEEREWRVIYSPNVARSPVVIPFVQTVRGVPQVIQKLPLVNDIEHGLNGAAIPDLLYRLIIGPTEDPFVTFDAFAVLLAEAGVENPAERIWPSGIPLRQW